MKNTYCLRASLLFAGLLLASCSVRAEDTTNTGGAVAAESAAKTSTDYHITTATDPAAVKVNSEASFALTITPKSPWALKAETPLEVSLKPSKNVELKKTTLTAKDLQDPKAAAKSLRTALKAVAAGEHHVEAQLSFFLCKDDVCQRFTDEVKTTFEATL